MNNMPFASILFILIGGLCFVLFIMFNFAYYNTDNGLFTILDNHAQNDMDANHYNWFSSINDHVKTGIGFGGVLLLGLGLLTALASGFNKKETE